MNKVVGPSAEQAGTPADAEGMARLIRRHDWASTPLGPMDGWPERLKAVVDTVFASPQAMWIGWGPDLIQIYNDGYRALIDAERHRAALGQPARKTWADNWSVVGPMLTGVMAGGPPVSHVDRREVYQHEGELRERHFSFSFSPIPDPGGGVGGVLCVAAESTPTVLLRESEAALRESEGRLRFLSRLDDTLRAAHSAPDAMLAAAELLAGHLGASRCAYADVDADSDRFIIRSDYSTPGLASSAGTYSLDLFGSRAAADMRSGQTLVVRDVPCELASDDGREMFLAIGISAIVCCPLLKDGRLVAMMAVHQTSPRDWRSDEVALVEAVVERCWAYVERVGAEARLRESEAQFRAFTQAVPNHVWAARPDGALYWFNDQVYAYSGEPAGSLDGSAWGRIVHPEDLPEASATWAHALATGEVYETEFRIRRADGRYRWFLVRAEPVCGAGGTIQNWVGTNTDIDDRRRAEAALHELNETLERRVSEALAERNMLAKLVELTDVMVMAVDLDYNILALNTANADEFERIYGVRPKAGDNMLELLADQPEHREQVRAGWGLGMQGEQLTFVEEFGDPDRVRPYYQVNFRPLRNEDGEQIGVYQFVIDVTERLRNEAQLAEAQEQLRQSQKLEAMGQLTGGVAHDFNNLLTPIIGSLDRLLTRGVGSPRERQLMDGALQSAERAKTLVQRLLAFARRQPLQLVSVDVRALVEGMAELIGSTLGPTIEVRVELPPDLPLAKADPNQLEMALLNLAVNARDAMPEGGTLTIAASRESVQGRERAGSGLKQGHYVRLSVSDSGVGMDEATLARAVEPFFSTKGIGRGTGLGLSMVHGLAAQLGGGLTIRSTPGQGTTVELWLPLSAEPINAEDEERVATPLVATRGRALLVDDEDLVRMSTADMLTDLGFDVLEAGRAEDALRLLQDGAAVDLLVTDHLMPGMSGAELARTARQLRPGLPALVVSGYAEVEGLAPDLPRLVKPFRIADLGRSVAMLLPGTEAETPKS